MQRKGSSVALQPRRLEVCSCPHGRAAKLRALLWRAQCRLPGAEGTWMVVRGGMGTVTSQLAQASPYNPPCLPSPAAACGTVRSSWLGACAGAEGVASLSSHSPPVRAGCEGGQIVNCAIWTVSWPGILWLFPMNMACAATGCLEGGRVLRDGRARRTFPK